jgi:hypothetical protein
VILLLGVALQYVRCLLDWKAPQGKAENESHLPASIATAEETLENKISIITMSKTQTTYLVFALYTSK